MIRTKYALSRLAVAGAVTCSILLFAAAAALAGGSSRYGTHDPWYANAAGGSQGVAFITDTLAPGGTSQGRGMHFVTDTLAPGGGGSTSPVATSSPGFDWPSAGVGAGVAVAAMLLILTGTIVTRRRAEPAI